jgi:hypothetical protein
MLSEVNDQNVLVITDSSSGNGVGGGAIQIWQQVKFESGQGYSNLAASQV